MTPINEILEKKAIDIKGKGYSLVKDRILALCEQEETYSISSEYEYFPDQKTWVVKATLHYKGESYVGLASESESDKSSEVNKISALENAQTSAVGRACAMAGIGVLDSIASADEINKAGRPFPKGKLKQERKITFSQENLLSKLINEKYTSEYARSKELKKVHHYSLAKASEKIDELMKAPVT